MSLADSPDRQFQSEDRALRALFPTIQDPLTNSFDDYINQTLWDLTDEEKEDFFLGDVGDLFDSEALSSGTTSQSPIVVAASARRKELSPQPWRKGLWCLNQNEPPREPEVLEDTYYLDEEQNRLKVLSRPLHRPDGVNPRSPPLTPSKKGTKTFVHSPKPATTRQSPYCRQTISREVTLSPSPMYARLPSCQIADYETWQQDFQNFNLQVRDESVPPSPPLSGRPAQNENVTRANAANVVDNSNQMPVLDMMMMPGYNLNHPLSSVEPIDPDLYIPRTRPQFVANGSGSSMIPGPTGQNVFSPNYNPQPLVQTIPTWPLDPTEPKHQTSAYVYRSPPQMAGEGGDQGWWFNSPDQADQGPKANFAGSHVDYYPQIAAPAPQRPVHQLVSSTSPNFSSGGLMIQYPSQPGQSIESEHIPVAPLASAPTTTATSASPTASCSYPPPPSLESERYRPVFSPGPSFPTTPQRRTRRVGQRQSPDRSTSLSPSNAATTTMTPRSIRQTSPTRSSRQKSLGNLKASSSGVSKTPRMPRTPKTPNGVGGGGGAGGAGSGSKTTGGGGLEMKFFNLTADDSDKLLNDVAPSGSSKTRARREQEARDRRRRLSEAAVRAVKSAGGDLQALETAITT